MPSFKPVVALSRGLEILRAVNEEGRATIRSLHKATGLDKATIVRMLETLEHEGYILRDADLAVYSPTGRVLQLSLGYDRHLWIGAVAEPILGEFRSKVGWPSDVAIFDRDAMVVVTTRGAQGPILINRRPGFRTSVLTTSLGRAYLAHCPEAEREQIVATLAGNPDPLNDLARQPRKLHAVLREARERGYAVMDDAYSERFYDGLVWAFAVPVASADRVHASINMMLLKSAVNLPQMEAQFLPALREAARKLAAALDAKP